MAQRLSAWYFWYFAFFGAFQPYFALYLQSIGLSAGRIAVLMSLGQFMPIFYTFALFLLTRSSNGKGLPW